MFFFQSSSLKRGGSQAAASSHAQGHPLPDLLRVRLRGASCPSTRVFLFDWYSFAASMKFAGPRRLAHVPSWSPAPSSAVEVASLLHEFGTPRRGVYRMATMWIRKDLLGQHLIFIVLFDSLLCMATLACTPQRAALPACFVDAFAIMLVGSRQMGSALCFFV